MNIDTPMFDKLLETKKDRELCTRFLAFLRKKGYLEADFDKEKEIAEFFEIDLGQAEKERIELVRSFSTAVPIDIFAIQGEIEGMPELNANGVNLNKENSPASKRSVGGGMNPLQENGIL